LFKYFQRYLNIPILQKNIKKTGLPIHIQILASYYPSVSKKIMGQTKIFITKKGVIGIIPDEAYYRDTVHGKMVSLLKIAASVVSGKTMDDGIEGNISF
jgi:hypothetical protein